MAGAMQNTNTGVTVRLYAAARAAAGGQAQQRSTATSLYQLVDELTERHGTHLRRVLDQCTFAVEGTAFRLADGDRALRAGSTVDVLPPFAGG